MLRCRDVLPFALLVSLGCVSAPSDLACPAGDCDDPIEAPPVDAPPEPLPVPPEIVSVGCEHFPTISWSEADLANTEVFEHPCVSELLNADGCVADRWINEFDEAGRIVSSERWIFDVTALPPMYVIPTNQRTEYEYDAQGRLHVTRVDGDSDGVVDRTTTWTHVGEERVETVVQGIGEDQYRIERRFDAAGRVTSETQVYGDRRTEVRRGYMPDGQLRFAYFDVDGVRTSSQEVTFDEEGRPLVDRRRFAEEGRTDTTAYRYDALGLVERTWTREDEGAADIVERHRFTRWPDGVLRSEDYEQVVNGSRVSRRRRTEYDQAGRELSALNDRNVDGIFEQGSRYTYDDDGNRLTAFTFDGNRVLRDLRFRFDDEGREIERRDEVGGTVTHTDYVGLVTTKDIYDLAGRRLSTTVTTVDADGNVLRIEADKNGDGQVDERYENTWTSSGARLRSVGDRDGDGLWDYEVAYMYDRAGLLLYQMSDSDRDGSPERANLSNYACQR